jgi:FkbM family methyltransferase
MLKKIFRIVFPVKTNSIDFYEKNISWLPGLINWEKIGNIYLLKFEEGYSIKLRDNRHSDLLVYRQVFVEQQYKIILELLKQFQIDFCRIIDAGSNVGFTSLYFHLNLVNTKIVAIEPSPGNLDVLHENFKINRGAIGITVLDCALANDSDLRFDNSNSFRDGLDWSNRTVENKEGSIKSVAIADILITEDWDVIDFLKIDVEGYEKELFSKKASLNYLNKVRIIAVEVHEEAMSIKDMVNILINYDFLVFNVGELTIGINKRFIGFTESVQQKSM